MHRAALILALALLPAPLLAQEAADAIRAAARAAVRGRGGLLSSGARLCGNPHYRVQDCVENRIALPPMLHCGMKYLIEDEGVSIAYPPARLLARPLP